MRILLLAILCVSLTCSEPLAAQQAASHDRLALTNDGVIAMLKAKFDDETIIKMIQQHNTNFDLSVNEMIRLKQAGVSQAVLRVMIEAVPDSKKVQPSDALPADKIAEKVASSDAELPDEIGLYLVRKTGLVAIEPEIVNWQTGGVVKQMATLGLDKGHLNGTVAGPHSSLNVASSFFGYDGPIEFILRCPDGTSASEYLLLRFWEKSDRREFRSVTGGVFHASGGAKDNVVEFRFQKLGPRTYRVKIPSLERGEYGFLAPGETSSASLGSHGKVYTFHIAE